MTIEEIKALDIDAIETRMAEIKDEMNAENADLDALNKELDAIEERRASIKEEVEKRAKVVEEVIAQPKAEPIIIEERKTMTELEIRKSPEYVDAYAEYIKTNDDTECRALLTENASGKVAVPVIVEDIVRTAWEREGIMSRVRKSYLRGNVKVGFELSATGADIHTEGAAAPSEETLVLGTVSLVPQSIKKWITISDEALDLRGEAFLRYIYDEVAYQIAKKAADTLVAKIKAAGTASTATAVGVAKVTSTTVSVGLIAQAVANLSDQAQNPTIMMNKQTWASFKAAQYAANYPVDPFEGLPVEFNNTIASFTAATTGVPYVLVGDLGYGALANFPNGEEITFKYDDLSLAERDLVKIVGREYVALGLVAPGAFVKIVK